MHPLSNRWPSRHPSVTLAPDCIHVWRAFLFEQQGRLPDFYATLDPEERDRAGRFVFERDRQRYIISHGILRDILARYSGQAAHTLRFVKNSYGKPQLLSTTAAAGLHFNLSHSHDLALYAIALDRPVGVDVEWMRPEFAGLDIARHSFAPAEIAALIEVPASQQRQAFFNCWTRKEAYIKAVGQGLGIDLNSFIVSLKPDEPARLCSINDDVQSASGWTMRALDVHSDYAAAVASESPLMACLQWTWQPLSG
ncbi:MAG: 4'-phosphopantetheinyl transferase superfamily protein [Herpetosiphonaceae bacterium]|nr:4'-phosphopantetheinyl transferase superfamily protein [Herpetosiphonaceae bacterium]